MNIENYKTIGQEHAHERTTSKYSFIPTSKPLAVLADHGWYPSKIQEANTRKIENVGFQKHIVRLRNREVSKGEEFPEIVLINSHMGNASFQLMLGYYRLVCSNGMVVGNTLETHKINHIGYADDAVSEAVKQIIDVTPSVDSNIQAWKSIELSPEEQNAYASGAIELKFDGEKYAVEPRQVLWARRSIDKANDLWTTFNKVQENLVRGGVSQRRSDGTRIRSKAIKSIDEDVRVNRALWMLTEKMAELRSN